MKIKIEEVRKEGKDIKKFTKNEWSQFNRERGYRWNEQKYALVARDNKKVVGYASFKING